MEKLIISIFWFQNSFDVILVGNITNYWKEYAVINNVQDLSDYVRLLAMDNDIELIVNKDLYKNHWVLFINEISSLSNVNINRINTTIHGDSLSILREYSRLNKIELEGMTIIPL